MRVGIGRCRNRRFFIFVMGRLKNAGIAKCVSKTAQGIQQRTIAGTRLTLNMQKILSERQGDQGILWSGIMQD